MGSSRLNVNVDEIIHQFVKAVINHPFGVSSQKDGKNFPTKYSQIPSYHDENLGNNVAALRKSAKSQQNTLTLRIFQPNAAAGCRLVGHLKCIIAHHPFVDGLGW